MKERKRGGEERQDRRISCKPLRVNLQVGERFCPRSSETFLVRLFLSGKAERTGRNRIVLANSRRNFLANDDNGDSSSRREVMKWTEGRRGEKERDGLEAEFLRVNGNPPVCLQTSETGSEGSAYANEHALSYGLCDRAKGPPSMGGTKRRYPLFQPFSPGEDI